MGRSCVKSEKRAPHSAITVTSGETRRSIPWPNARPCLTRKVGNDLSVSVIIPKIIDSEEVWPAVVSFCETVMTQNEAAERVRRREALSPPGDNEEEEEETEEKGNELASFLSSTRPKTDAQ